MRRAKDFHELSLVGLDPFWRRQRTDGASKPFPRIHIFLDQGQRAGEEALKQVHKVLNGRDIMSHGRKERSVEDHLPLQLAIRGEERRSVNGNLKTESRSSRHAAGGAVRASAFDRDEHTRVGRSYVDEGMFLLEVGFEREEPFVGAGIGRSECVGTGERNARPMRPFVHVGDVTREDKQWGHVAHGWKRVSDTRCEWRACISRTDSCFLGVKLELTVKKKKGLMAGFTSVVF
jgi:hypothetical protein